MQWYYARGSEQVGPLEDRDFKRLIASGDITAETLVWNETLSGWVAHGTLSKSTSRPKLKMAGSLSAATPEAAADHAEAESPADAGFMIYGGFWIRFVAKIIDNIISGVLISVVAIAGMAAVGAAVASEQAQAAAIVGVVTTLLQVLASVGYATFFLGKFGATPGKMIEKLQVVRPDGTPISYQRACGRYFAEILSGLIFSIGYIVAAFSSEKKTWHDAICDTRVLRR